MKLAKIDKTLQPKPLSPAQLNAIELLAQGYSDTDTAKAVKVSRQTIHAWRTGSTDFQEALEQTRAELWKESRNQLRTLTLKAIGTLRQAIEGGSVLASVAVLRHALAIMPEDTQKDNTIRFMLSEQRDKCYAGEVLELMELRKKLKPEIDFESMSESELADYSRAYEARRKEKRHEQL